LTQQNLIIYGLPESSATSAPERQIADLKNFKELVDSEFKIDNYETTKCFRLGKPRKPRLLRVTLTENVIRRQILRNARHLRNSNAHKNVLVSPDLTLQEREANKRLSQELKRRKDAGDSNLIIKYRKLSKSNHLTKLLQY